MVGVVGLLSLQDQHNCKTDITGRVRFCFVFELSEERRMENFDCVTLYQ